MAGVITSFATATILTGRRIRAVETLVTVPRLFNSNLSLRQRCLHFLSLPLTTIPPDSSSVAGICHVAHAFKGDAADGLLKGVGDKNAIEAVKHILDMARRASSRREVLHTDFLTPPVLKESMLVLEKLADVKAVAQGGYPQAERCRLSVGHSEAMTTIPDIVEALSITGNFGFQPCSHGDFLGAILGTGIAREKLGDILLQGEKGAQILIIPELVDFLVIALDKVVGNVPVTCTRIPLLALEYEPPRTKSFKAIEASLRVDALASAGFKISRSKLVDLISNGDVRINWSPVTKNGTTLKTGDVVSVSGKGRLKIGEINTTKKGKFAVELIQYL
ncbi:RNA-binding S4 domain [Macleaya cordata]|uniref:RNA-binding S4 domain n=1 Tax=Macleaya cordata TaxID=56857 RepID=A0A200QBA3_MACCD|nr:RNA-binding S4 domain [Macleaya cordata]